MKLYRVSVRQASQEQYVYNETNVKIVSEAKLIDTIRAIGSRYSDKVIICIEVVEADL